MFSNAEAVKSFLAHIVSAVSSAAGVLLLFGVSQGDVTRIGSAIQQVGEGVVSIIGGLLIIIPVIGGLYAAFKQTTGFWLRKQNADPEIKRVVVAPGTEAAKIAEAIPGDKIVVAAF
jgi:uncharacterized membrane protein